MSELFFHEYQGKEVSNNKPNYLVIFLHGYGANGANLIDLAKEFEYELPDAHFISPNAPQNWEGGFPDCYQWFSLASWGSDRDATKISGAIKKANQQLQEFIQEQIFRFRLSEEKVFLVGFSQGAMMAMYQGFISKKNFAGIVAFSGKLILPEMIGEMSRSKPEICLIHGCDDSVLPFENFLMSRELLVQQGIDFEEHALEGLDHSIDLRGVRAALGFIRRINKNL